MTGNNGSEAAYWQYAAGHGNGVAVIFYILGRPPFGAPVGRGRQVYLPHPQGRVRRRSFGIIPSAVIIDKTDGLASE
jgi:hypothetical protein